MAFLAVAQVTLIASAPAALAIDGVVGRVAWHVPESHFQFVRLRERSESWLAEPAGPISAPQPKHLEAQRCLSLDRVDQDNGLPAFANWPVTLGDDADAGALARWSASAWSEASSLSDSSPAAVPESPDPSQPFDAASFARLDRQSTLTSPPPAELAAEFGLARQGFSIESQSSFSPYLVEPVGLLDDRGDPGVGEVPQRFSLEAIRRRPSGPAGTMYLWSIEPDERGAGDPFSPSARYGPSAGVVLTRPPGDYSLDWVGVAVTAPIH